MPLVLARLGLLIPLLALAGCKDEGVQKLRQARAHYQQLVERGLPPVHPEFDHVLAELRSVPARSRAHDEAQALIRQLERGRGPRPARPLATSEPTRPESAEIARIEAECAALARELGSADVGERERFERSVAECQRRRDRRIEEEHHGAAP